MRKKTVVMLVMAILVVPLLPTSEVVNLTTLDGDDWVSWNRPSKDQFIIGVMMANYFASDMLWEMDNLSEEGKHVRAVLNEMRYYRLSELVGAIDRYYANQGNRSTPLYIAMYLVSRNASDDYDQRRRRGI